MSDKELVKRLRDAVNGEHDMTPHGADCLQAADRIEELKAKLAKVVEMALEDCPYRDGTGWWEDWWHDRRATLAEIENSEAVTLGEKG